MLKKVQMRGGARRPHARRTWVERAAAGGEASGYGNPGEHKRATLSGRPRAPTKQMGLVMARQRCWLTWKRSMRWVAAADTSGSAAVRRCLRTRCGDCAGAARARQTKEARTIAGASAGSDTARPAGGQRHREIRRPSAGGPHNAAAERLARRCAKPQSAEASTTWGTVLQPGGSARPPPRDAARGPAPARPAPARASLAGTGRLTAPARRAARSRWAFFSILPTQRGQDGARVVVLEDLVTRRSRGRPWSWRATGRVPRRGRIRAPRSARSGRRRRRANSVLLSVS